MKALILLLVVQSHPTALDTTAAAAAFESTLEHQHDNLEDPAALYESLEEAAQWRIPVNYASAEALRTVPGISEPDVRRILLHRTAAGPIDGPSDLHAAGLTAGTAAAILPFVSFDVRPGRSEPRIRIDAMQRWSRRVDVAEGHRRAPPTGYAGSPDALQTRVRLRIGDSISACMILDKDAGEPISWSLADRRFGADFATLNVTFDRVGPVERLVAGSYAVQVGEGLVLGHGTGGMSSVRVGSADRLLRPHVSSREHAHFRGLAVHTQAVYGLRAAAFLSSSRLDARLDTVLGSWRLTAPGYHRTETERNGRRILHSRVVGGTAVLRVGPAYAGALALHTRQALGSTRRDIPSVSVFGGLTRRRYSVTFELVPGRGHRSVTASFAPARETSFTVRARYTPEGGLRPHTRIGVNSSGESLPFSDWAAECRFKPLGRWETSLKVGERRRQDGPLRAAQTRRSAVILEYRAAPWMVWHLRATARSADEPTPCRTGPLLLSCTSRHLRRSLRVQLDYRHSHVLRTRTRFEFVRASSDVHASPAAGLLLFQDVRWRLFRGLQFDLRFSIFDAPDAAARLYMLESDVPYGFSAPTLTGRGRRWYVLARADPFARISFQLRCSATIYEDVRSVGYGLDEVPGNRVREIKLQIQWRMTR